MNTPREPADRGMSDEPRGEVDPTARAVLARILAEHVGMETDPLDVVEADHYLAALADAGYSVVRLAPVTFSERQREPLYRRVKGATNG